MKKFFALVVTGSALAVGSAVQAADVSLPTIGVNVGDYITAGITVVGGCVAVALGGYAAFWAIRKSLKWFNRAA